MITDLHLLCDGTSDPQALSQRAHALLDMLASPPCPIEYAVAFTYESDRNAELRRALEPMIRQGDKIGQKQWHDLFDRFIMPSSADAWQSVGEALKSLLSSMVDNLGEAGQSAQAFTGEIEGALARLARPQDLTREALFDAAKHLLAAGEAAKERTAALQAKMQTTIEEAQRLSAELEDHRRAVLHDPLTGLLNRRGMDMHFDGLIGEGDEHPTLSVLMVDIDHFKSFNDKFGHAVGDAVLRNVAKAIGECIRSTDHAVRYGGEEFLVILPDAALEQALEIAEKIRTKIGTLRLVRRRDNLSLPPLTVSVGVAVLRNGEDAETVVIRADGALYESKNGGRNRVTVA